MTRQNHALISSLDVNIHGRFGSFVERLMQYMFTANWNDWIEYCLEAMANTHKEFHSQIHSTSKNAYYRWERNSRKHGQKPRDMTCLTKIVDKTVGLKLLSVKENGKAL